MATERDRRTERAEFIQLLELAFRKLDEAKLGWRPGVVEWAEDAEAVIRLLSRLVSTGDADGLRGLRKAADVVAGETLNPAASLSGVRDELIAVARREMNVELASGKMNRRPLRQYANVVHRTIGRLLETPPPTPSEEPASFYRAREQALVSELRKVLTVDGSRYERVVHGEPLKIIETALRVCGVPKRVRDRLLAVGRKRRQRAAKRKRTR